MKYKSSKIKNRQRKIKKIRWMSEVKHKTVTIRTKELNSNQTALKFVCIHIDVSGLCESVNTY